jgi:hypothetical protein
MENVLKPALLSSQEWQASSDHQLRSRKDCFYVELPHTA